MSKWKKVSWSDVLTIKNGKNQRAVEDINGKYPIYGSGGVMGYASDYLCEEDAVIIGRKGSINNPIYVSEKFWNVDTAFGLVANIDMIFPKYLYYFCLLYDFERLNTTVTIPSLTKSKLLEVKMPLPPLETQRKIAKTLDTVSEMLALRKQQLAELDNLIKSTFYEMFGNPVTNERGWNRCYIIDVFDIIDGDRGNQYPKQEDFMGEGYCLFLNTGNVTKEGFEFNNTKFISAEKDKQLRKGKLERGDIVFTTRGTVGNIAYYNNSIPYDVVRINSGMVIFRHRKTKITPEFFCQMLKSLEMAKEITSYLSGTAQPQLPITNIKKLKVIMPPINLQNSFNETVVAIDKQKAQIQEAINETQYLFDCLLSRYFD